MEGCSLRLLLADFAAKPQKMESIECKLSHYFRTIRISTIISILTTLRDLILFRVAQFTKSITQNLDWNGAEDPAQDAGFHRNF